MDYLLSQYKSKFKEYLSNYGFRSFQKTFFRVVNDVTQKIILDRTRSGCTIQFGIMPLSFPVDSPACLHGGRYQVGMFRNSKSWWSFESNTPNEIDPIIAEMLDSTHNQIIPFFERANNSSNAYKEIIKYEKTIYTGIPGGVIMNDPVKVSLCIKMGDFDRALKHQEAIVAQNEDAIASNIADREKRGEYESRDAYKAKFEPMLASVKEEAKKIALPDVEYFAKLIKENEEKSIEYLKHPSRKI